MLMLTSKSSLTAMLYRMTTAVKLETAIEENGRISLLPHTHAKSGCL